MSLTRVALAMFVSGCAPAVEEVQTTPEVESRALIQVPGGVSTADPQIRRLRIQGQQVAVDLGTDDQPIWRRRLDDSWVNLGMATYAYGFHNGEFLTPEFDPEAPSGEHWLRYGDQAVGYPYFITDIRSAQGELYAVGNRDEVSWVLRGLDQRSLQGTAVDVGPCGDGAVAVRVERDGSLRLALLGSAQGLPLLGFVELAFSKWSDPGCSPDFVAVSVWDDDDRRLVIRPRTDKPDAGPGAVRPAQGLSRNPPVWDPRGACFWTASLNPGEACCHPADSALDPFCTSQGDWLGTIARDGTSIYAGARRGGQLFVEELPTPSWPR